MKRLFLILPVIFIFVSCAKKTAQINTIPEPLQQTKNHAWYYLSETGINKIERIQDTPVALEKPWTEAVRISSMASNEKSSDSSQKAFALANRLGVIVFDGDNASIVPDTGIFNGRTADNLVFYDNEPVFSVYRNSFFNKTSAGAAVQNDGIHPFLVAFNLDSEMTMPLLSLENIGYDVFSEVTDFVWDGTCWICSVKTESDARTEFSFVSVQPKVPLLSISPSTASDKLFIREVEKDAFRKLKTPESFSSAPDRLQQLLASIPHNRNIEVTCYTAGGHSPRIFTRLVSDKTTLVATSCISDTWIFALFQDGTFYFRGALNNSPVLNDGKIVALRLPKLPSGFIYSSACISGGTLYAAWEETAFYKTGRSGFLSVDINSVIAKGF